MLAAHGEEGAFGWVLNGKHVMSLTELLARALLERHPVSVPGMVRAGGPVSPEQVWLLYRTEDRFEGVEGEWELGAGLVACASRRVLELIQERGRAPEVVALAGYAGWAPSQLEEEIRAGAWLPADLEPGWLLETPAQELWGRAYARLGTTPLAFTSKVIGSA